MGAILELDSFEKQFLDIVAEFQTLATSEKSLREIVRAECSRAEAAEAARDGAERAAEEARAGAAAATAGATHAAAALARLQEQLTAVNLQLEVTDRQRCLLEERCSELSSQVSTLEREVQQLRPFQASYQCLQRQYHELEERVRVATEDARNEAAKVENDVRRVEKCAGSGEQVRSHARLAAAAHARERRLAAEELRSMRRKLANANAEIARLNIVIAGYQTRTEKQDNNTEDSNKNVTEEEYIMELRAALAAERAGAARLEHALTSALKDCAALADKIPTEKIEGPSGSDQDHADTKMTLSPTNTNITAIDSFLAESVTLHKQDSSHNNDSNDCLFEAA